jgi:hypothetical protein
MAELIPSVLFPSLIDKRYFLFHPNVELIPFWFIITVCLQKEYWRSTGGVLEARYVSHLIGTALLQVWYEFDTSFIRI